MISDETRANRLRRHKKSKRFYEIRLELAVSDRDKKHFEARIAEVERKIEATKLPETVKEDKAAPMPTAEEKNVEAQLFGIAEKDKEMELLPVNVEGENIIPPLPSRKQTRAKSLRDPSAK